MLSLSLFLALTPFVLTRPASAHQPYCELTDLTYATPWRVPDASVSYAYFGNLYPARDVDYFTFEATAGQSVLLSLSIPAVEGQADFAPVMAVFGPDIEAEEMMLVPKRVKTPEDQAGLMVPLGEEPVYWFEPFGQRYYWNWENYFFEAPEDAIYTVALWHPEERLGRYSFVIGEEEIRGGDPDCRASFDQYWTPLLAGENPYQEAETGEDSHMHADGKMHKHDDLLDVSEAAAPLVDLQVFPLSDGTYNVRIQTLNFRFAPHKVGSEPVPGEGHAHLYIDDTKIARIYGEWYHLEALPEAAQMISVGLYANNHQPLAVDGLPLTDEVIIDAELVAFGE